MGDLPDLPDLKDLERRLTAALDRIGVGVAGLAVPVAVPAVDPDAPDPALLEAQLDAEREVSAQLEERLRALRRRHDTKVAELTEDLAQTRARAEAAERASGRDGGDGVSRLRAELDAARAAHAADRAEMDAILADLAPLLEEGDGHA